MLFQFVLMGDLVNAPLSSERTDLVDWQHPSLVWNVSQLGRATRGGTGVPFSLWGGDQVWVTQRHCSNGVAACTLVWVVKIPKTSSQCEFSSSSVGQRSKSRAIRKHPLGIGPWTSC